MCCHGGVAANISRQKRFLYRLPVGLYRIGLGRLLGRRFLCLEHLGRTSGLTRRTVLEVIAHEGGKPVVPVAFGTTTDWYRNLLARPSARITWGGVAGPVTAQVLDETEAAGVLVRYVADHRWAARSLDRLVGLGLVDDPAAAARKLPLIRLATT